MSDGLRKCFSEGKIRGLVLRNRLIKAATFEGKSDHGIPSEPLMRFHERIAEGGVGMTTLAYCASEGDGRISENMLYMHEGIRTELEMLIRRVHRAGAKISGQLGHCGSFSKNREFNGKRLLGPSSGINPLGLAYGLPYARRLTKPQIKQRVATFSRAAAFMKSVGFDAIEIHFGHGYGISQFISPRTNHRKDEYGGSLENRMRFALEVLAAIRDTVGDRFALIGKISMTDGVPGGVTYDEGVEIAALLEAGGIDLIVCSGGTSSMNPMLLFRGDSLLPGLLEQEKSAFMRMGMRLAGKRMFREYAYEELYFFDQARRIRDRVQCGVCYVGGAATSVSFAKLMEEGFDFIQLGRPLLFDPDLPRRAATTIDYQSGCNHCNRCATLIDSTDGIECVERPAHFKT